jgi:ribonuclease BN (tRNA processing enzyme)
MRIVLLGTGSIVPTTERFCSGAYLESGGAKILVDCGPGIIEKLSRVAISPHKIDAVLLTHYHIDHVSDLLPLIKLRAYGLGGNPDQSPQPLEIMGPPGLHELLNHLIDSNSFFEYLRTLMKYQNYTKLTVAEEGRTHSIAGLEVRVLKVPHDNGVAYKIGDGKKSAVFSGDTAPYPRLAEFAREVDILIHECSFPAGLIIGQHTSENDLAEIVAEARPRIVVATHLYPAWQGQEDRLVKAIEKAHECRVIVGRDMLEIKI